jgi:hypothetical protein
MHAKGIPATKQICKINLLMGHLAPGRPALAARPDTLRLLPSPCPAFPRITRACSSPVPLPLGRYLTVHTCGEIIAPLPLGAAAMGHVGPRIPAARMLLLARDDDADWPHPAE